jgi:hypothetical protein
MHIIVRLCTLPVVLLHLVGAWAMAQAAADTQTPPEAYRLETMHIEGGLENRATGRSVIPRTVIPHLMRGNGNINELLEVLPDVQVDRRHSNSLSGGEILPPEVSISGGKSFQNNFTIDGISNNSLLDPVARNPNSLTDVPGHSQELFLDSALVEEITVYDSNVPARFGNFTGGVVDARTRSPMPRFGGKLTYRTTRDGWTRFHLTPGSARNSPCPPAPRASHVSPSMMWAANSTSPWEIRPACWPLIGCWNRTSPCTISV